MLKRLICCDHHQVPYLEIQQCPEQPPVPIEKMPVNTQHHSSPWGIKQQKFQLTCARPSLPEPGMQWGEQESTARRGGITHTAAGQISATDEKQCYDFSTAGHDREGVCPAHVRSP